jgi:hypothetical protein
MCRLLAVVLTLGLSFLPPSALAQEPEAEARPARDDQKPLRSLFVPGPRRHTWLRNHLL